MLTNAYNAAQKLELGNFFKNINPPENSGYMFWDDPRIGRLGNALASDGHSGSSFAWVCRSLQAYYQDPVGFENLYKNAN
jgi:hypothetical protein